LIIFKRSLNLFKSFRMSLYYVYFRIIKATVSFEFLSALGGGVSTRHYNIRFLSIMYLLFRASSCKKDFVYSFVFCISSERHRLVLYYVHISLFPIFSKLYNFYFLFLTFSSVLSTLTYYFPLLLHSNFIVYFI